MADRQGIREALAAILKAVSDTPQLLTDRVKQALGGLLERVRGVIGGAAPQETPIEAPPPPPIVPPRTPPPQIPVTPQISPDQQETINMLWQLSGGIGGVFQSYLNTFPDPELQSMASTPEGIQQIANLVMGEPVDYTPSMAGGVPQSAIQSSNVYGVDYDPKNQKLKVKFNGRDQRAAGPTYEYGGVPPEVAQMVESGAMSATTNGQNRFGRWWRGKNPSVGASANQLLKNGPFPYQRIA